MMLGEDTLQGFNAYRTTGNRWQVVACRFVTWLAVCMVLGRGHTTLAVDPVQALRERYLGPDGLPSAQAYDREQGIAPVPGSVRVEWQPIFKIAYRKADVDRLHHATPVATDCSFVRRTTYTAPFRAQPVWDGRVYLKDNQLVAGAYTKHCEQVVGSITEKGLQAHESLEGDSIPLLQIDNLQYNPFTGQLWRREPGGQIEIEQPFFLPLPLMDVHGRPVRPDYKIVGRSDGTFELVARLGIHEVALARCTVDPEQPNQYTHGYSPGRSDGCHMATEEPTVVMELAGEIITNAVDTGGSQPVLKDESLNKDIPRRNCSKPSVQIDGRFDDWRSAPGIADPKGDIAAYLQYNPDTDLLEFKVANDNKYLYFYTRVVGRHGNTGPGNDRYYFYVYIDVDQDPTTGYLPTRDDDCYYGVAIGDDCEAQFEFVGGRFIKTFFGFTGAATEKEVLSGKVAVAPSWYSKHDSQGRLRPGYKVEYVRQGGRIMITEDYAEGTSDDIVIALSPDGSECEMRAELAGFLQSPNGAPIISLGQHIDLAAGVEASGRIHGNTKWGADSTAAIRGYHIAE